MNDYQKEHADAFRTVMSCLESMPADGRTDLVKAVAPYVDFRARVDRFLGRYFADHCAPKCFQSRLSACCSREGIVAFFADVAINCLHSSADDIHRIIAALERPNRGHRCIHLAESGCRWRVTPIVCAMFLCDQAKSEVFGASPEAEAAWKGLEAERKRYTWPDRPVVFDLLELRFLEAGCESPLMYLNTSPGLLRVKRDAGLLQPRRKPHPASGTKG